MAKEDALTLSAVKELGFTPALISRLLPEPELRPNPMYRSAAPMKLWQKSDVDKAMETEDFKAAMVQRESRRAAARKAVSTKREKNLSELPALIDSIRVRVVDVDDIRYTVMREKSKRAFDRGDDCFDPDEKTFLRWMVNFVRHNLTEYDSALGNIWGKVGTGELYVRMKTAVLDKIAEAYPSLAEECIRQKENIDGYFYYFRAAKEEQDG